MVQIVTSLAISKLSFRSKWIFLSSFAIKFNLAFDVGALLPPVVNDVGVLLVNAAVVVDWGVGLRMLFFGDKSSWLFREYSESSLSSELLRKLLPVTPMEIYCKKYSQGIVVF